MAGVVSILPLFGINADPSSIERIGSGHINQTYRVGRSPAYVLQRININVFKNPELIASNIRHAAEYLERNFPEYRFMACLRSVNGREMEYDEEGYPWRVYPFIDDTMTIDQVDSPQRARAAAREFGRLTRCLDGADPEQFQPTIPRFHDLSLRKKQFEEALASANASAREEAATYIAQARQFFYLVEEYEKLISGGSLRLRVVHNDTKINNVLFDRLTNETVAVIDLDTLMPGYFIYDLGDMVRTFVSPVSEEEKDPSTILFRKEVYEALLEGYLSEMDAVLDSREREAIPFSGLMMTYIMALRFLADHLRGNTYYHITYPGQNLVRAANQLRLLEVLAGALNG